LSHFFEVDAIPWHFVEQAGPVLQVHPRVTCANGWSGNGFLEFGFPFFPNRQHRFCDNFEVVAHETGHLIMKSMVGTMPDDEKSLQHRAHEEAAADLIALVTTAALRLRHRPRAHPDRRLPLTATIS